MSGIEAYIILILVGVIAGFLNVMAGGGSTLTLPLLIFLGLDSTTANGTNRIAILVQNFVAILSFKQEKYYQFKLSFKMAAFTLPGGLIGALLATRIEDKTFNFILGLIMIGVIVAMLIPKAKIDYKQVSDKAPWLIYLAMFGIGFYGGFIQVGVGFILMAAINYILKVSLVFVNMHKVFIVLFFTIPALIVFIVTDNIDYTFGFILAIGNAVGGWIAAKVTVKKGEGIIRFVLIVAILLMSIKLMGII